METLDTTLCILAKHLPKEYVLFAGREDETPYGPDEEIADVELTVEFEPGYYVPPVLSGDPDNWAPAEGEPPEIHSIEIDVDGKNLEVLNTLPDCVIEKILNKCWDYQQDVDREPDYAPADFVEN